MALWKHRKWRTFQGELLFETGEEGIDEEMRRKFEVVTLLPALAILEVYLRTA